MPKDEPRKLDLERWTSVDDALSELEPRSRVFEGALHPYLDLNQREADGLVTMFSLFAMSAASRARGLHEAIVREIGKDNPHSTFPLMRTLLETAALSFYVSENPRYVWNVAESPRQQSRDTPKRKSLQGLVDYMDRSGNTAHLATVYRQLCDIAHFGSLGMWAAYTIDNDDERRFSWTSVPRFRDGTALIACGQLDELTTLMEGTMRQLGRRMLEEHGFRPGTEANP